MKRAAPRLGKVLEFMRVLWAVDHELQSRSKQMAAALGVTGPQRLVVRIVGRFPAITAGRLAELMHVHPSTLTGVLRRLERRGVLRRESDPDDGRRARFRLTAAGRTVDQLRAGTVESALRSALVGIPERKLAAARELLAVLSRRLEAAQ